MAEIRNLESFGEFETYISGPGLTLLHFFVPWNPQCLQMQKVLVDLGLELGNTFNVAYIDAEKIAKASLLLNIRLAPTIIFYRDGIEIDRFAGFKLADLRTLIVKHTVENTPQSLNERLIALINKQPLMLFMKGNPDAPRCGFSRAIVDMLNEKSIKFGFFDILSDEEVRQGLKEYSNWPTYPQLYHEGNLIGGLDVVKEEFKDGEFVASLPKRT